jgi:hypothetical protein
MECIKVRLHSSRVGEVSEAVDGFNPSRSWKKFPKYIIIMSNSDESWWISLKALFLFPYLQN